jgi:hypothetical protein
MTNTVLAVWDDTEGEFHPIDRTRLLDSRIIDAKENHPGKWCCVQTYAHGGSAAKAANHRLPRRYEGQPVEFEARAHEGQPAVWVRWHPDTDPEKEPA